MINPTQESILSDLYPTEDETASELEAMPTPEILPTSESVLNAGEPEPEFEPIESPVLDVAIEPDFWESLAVPKLNNYVPRETSIPETDIEGSVFMASLQRENSIGSFLTRGSSREPANVDTTKFNIVEHLTPEQMPDMIHYALDTSQEQIDETSAILARERKNEAILQAHPYQAFGSAIITAGILDPINYAPFGAIYKQAKTASGVAKVFATGAMSTVASTTAQEAILHNTQLTRTIDESIWNVSVSGLLGGALGTAANQLGKRYRIEPAREQRAYNRVMDIMIDPDSPPGGTVGAAKVDNLNDALADIPEIVKKSMFLSPGVRLASSDFKTANTFNSIFVESSLYTEANVAGQSYGPALETYIKQRKAAEIEHVVEYNNSYYAMLGIEGGPAISKKVRGVAANLGAPEMSAEQFAKRVSLSLVTDVPDTNIYVKRATEAMKRGYENSRKPLVEMGYLPDQKGTSTSEGYMNIIYNQQLIIEQGGRNAWGPGTFPQAVFDGMKESQRAANLFRKSSYYINTQKEIDMLNKQIKELKGEKKELANDKLKSLEDEFKSKAISYNKYILNKDGRLWDQIDDEALRENAMQVVDTILSQEGDKLLNPVLNRLTNPNSLKSRVLMIVYMKSSYHGQVKILSRIYRFTHEPWHPS